jgi:hypothetical protein
MVSNASTVPATAATLSRVILKARGENSVAQGRPFRFVVSLQNQTTSAITDSVELDLTQVATGDAVPFFYWKGSIGPSATVHLRSSVTPSQWFGPLGKYEITPQGGTASLTFKVTRSPIKVPRFEDVTDSAGLAMVHGGVHRCGDFAVGAAWGDVEGDGDLDLYLPQQTEAAKLWINNGGVFTDEAVLRGVDNPGMVGDSAVFADYDNDGDADLYVVNDGANRLYQNDGTGMFTDVAGTAGVAESGPGSSASWADYDNDGNLDLYVTNWARCLSGFQYYDDALYHNEGDGTFTDQTALLHLTGTTGGAGFEAAWFDYDRDGDQDLYLGNDFVGPKPLPNVFWRNDGMGTDGKWVFTNASSDAGLGMAMNTMGIGVGDYDRDLDLDLALSNIDATALMQNQGDGTFVDVAAEARTARPLQRVREQSITWAEGFFDFNNDGWQDLYQAAGALSHESPPEPQANATFVNAGDGTFLDLSAPSHAADEEAGRGVAFADYDRDGQMDFYLVNRQGHPRLFRNKTKMGGAHWLEVDTVGTTSNRDGCGAEVIAVINKQTKLLREVFCGSISLGSGSDSTLHFGLGAATSIRKLKIRWPSGIRQTLTDVNANQLLQVTEPSP